MALGTYSELQSAIGNWLARPGDPTLTPFVADFVRLAEARISRDLRVRAMEERAAVELDSAYLPLPERFVELRALRLMSDPVAQLELMSPEQIDALRLGSRRGRPRWYCVIGDEIQMAPVPDGPYAAELVYWRKLEPLSLAQPSNWLLANAPDVYLYASLLEATAFTGNDERIPLWTAAYERAVSALQAANDRGSWSGSAPQVRA